MAIDNKNQVSNSLNELKIEIFSSEDVRIFEGISSKTGNPFKIRTQNAYFYTPLKPHPIEFQLSLNENEPPYKEGFYAIDPSSFYRNRFDDLGFRLKLGAKIS